jgi:hypothetical protein
MANNYTQFSVALEGLDEVALTFADDVWEQMRDIEDDEDTASEADPAVAAARRIIDRSEGFCNDLVVERGTLYISHDETGDVDQAVAFQWADICSKPRPDEFGGGAVVFSRNGEKWMNSYQWAEKMVTALTDGTEKF